MASNEEMYVTKRDGELEIVSFDKILVRIKKVGQEVGLKLNYTSLAMKVIDQLYNKISTTKIDELTAEQCASLSSTHPDYNILAGRIIVSNHHKNSSSSFYEVMEELYEACDKQGKNYPLISDTLRAVLIHYGKEKIDAICHYERDYNIDYFGFKTLEKSYLIRIHKRIVERPQHMWLRVSIGIHGYDWDRIIETYHALSMKYFTHATPTLFNAGTPKPQLSSCYLMAMEEDSIDGIFNTLKDCALISKWAGGIGLHIHNVRATGSQIRGTNGTSNGIVPMLKVFNNTAKYVDQCVVPETFIYTTDGPIKMKDVLSGKTKIMNETGGIEVVENVLEHSYDGDIYHLSSSYFVEPLKVTPMHPLLSLQITNEKNTVNYQDIIYQLDRNLLQIEYVQAIDVEVNDYVVYKIPQYENDVVTLTEDDCFMYGLLLKNGALALDKYQNGFLFLPDYPQQSFLLAFIQTYFDKHLVEYEILKNKQYHTIHIRWKNAMYTPFRSSDLCYQSEKRILSRWLHLPIPKITKIIQGYIMSHGKEKNEEVTLAFDSSLRGLLEDIRYLYLRMGVLTVSNKTDTHFVLKCPSILKLMMDTTSFFRYKDYLFVRIEHVSKQDYTGVLYDLQMKTEHNYMIHHGIIHNGGGKRNGSIAIYLEPWHADIEMFLQMRKNHGDEELKARDLFYALWVPDLFMKRVKEGGKWTLMCPSECPGLSDVYSDAFETLYISYEKENKGRKTVEARDLWFSILDSQMETGTPYLLYKDASNVKSNQKNVGTIKSSNLCVYPDTMVLTDRGHFPIYSLWAGNYPSTSCLEPLEIPVWNGKEFSPVLIKKTGTNQTFIKVHTSDGMSLKCTPSHKFYVMAIDEESGELFSIIKEAKDLLQGDILEPCSFPVITEESQMEENIPEWMAFSKGCDSGILNIKKKKILSETIYVPRNENLTFKLQWLAGFIEPYILQASTPKPCENDDFSIKDVHIRNIFCVRIPSMDYHFLREVKWLVQTCGINTRVHFYKTEAEKENKKAIAEWILTGVQLRFLIMLGMEFSEPISGVEDDSYAVNLEETESEYFCPTIRISQVLPCTDIDDSYCFTEPLQHAGVFNGIRTSQCTEILEYSDENETAVCNLASIALPSYFSQETKSFDFEMLHRVTKMVTFNLNRIIDVNFYPTPKTERSNKRHRPIGIGVQGLADVFLMFGYSFTSPEAKELNKHIFETIYHAALEQSNELAKIEGPYPTFSGSPASQGKLQFDLWNVEHDSKRYDWEKVKKDIMEHGLRNSLLLAPMPTASTSQILGYNECIEPITSNIYSRRTMAGEFILVNKYLMNELISLDKWTDTTKNQIIANNGSIQNFTDLSEEIKQKYRTVWEIPMKELIDMAADRGIYICQSQSLNLWLEDPNYNTMTSMHFYSWNKGLKTGIYYLRRRPRHQAQQFTIEPERKQKDVVEDVACEMCSA